MWKLKIKSKQQMSESMLLATLLTIAGGFQDAYSYNCRGGVFANAQTGNIVLLGQNLATGNFEEVLDYLFPILAFVCGVYVTELVKNLCQYNNLIHWRQIVLVVESILLVCVGFMPESWNMTANVVMSFACAMQVNAFRKFRGIPCATTMCIGNLRSATEMMCRYHVTKDKELKRKSIHYYLIILIFAGGAALGALCSINIGLTAIWIPTILLVAGFVLMFIREDDVEWEK